tara:strand:- start:666 stop:905 length:240 start_codon:yes stop_codon:yes gene_type:complete
MDGVIHITAMVMHILITVMGILITVTDIITHIIITTTHIIIYHIIAEEETLIIIEQAPVEEPIMSLLVIPTVVPNCLDV